MFNRSACSSNSISNKAPSSVHEHGISIIVYFPHGRVTFALVFSIEIIMLFNQLIQFHPNFWVSILVHWIRAITNMLQHSFIVGGFTVIQQIIASAQQNVPFFWPTPLQQSTASVGGKNYPPTIKNRNGQLAMDNQPFIDYFPTKAFIERRIPSQPCLIPFWSDSLELCHLNFVTWCRPRLIVVKNRKHTLSLHRHLQQKA